MADSEKVILIHDFTFKSQALVLWPDYLPSLVCSFLPVMTEGQFLLTGGPIHVNFPSGLTLEEVQRKNPLVVRGGRYRPPDCEARHRTAIIIPHRHREHHLKFLLYYLHPFLQRQQLQYGIYIIHQVKHTQQSQTLSRKEESKSRIRDWSDIMLLVNIDFTFGWNIRFVGHSHLSSSLFSLWYSLQFRLDEERPLVVSHWICML